MQKTEVKDTEFQEESLKQAKGFDDKGEKEKLKKKRKLEKKKNRLKIDDGDDEDDNEKEESGRSSGESTSDLKSLNKTF